MPRSLVCGAAATLFILVLLFEFGSELCATQETNLTRGFGWVTTGVYLVGVGVVMPMFLNSV